MGSCIPLPLDLGVIGAPKCNVLVDPLATGCTAGGTTGQATYMVPIPQDPNLKGVPVYFQGMAIDLGSNALGLTTSNGVCAWMGT